VTRGVPQHNFVFFVNFVVENRSVGATRLLRDSP